MTTLAGKVAIVTGSTSGIGAATAEYFAKLGAKVVVCGRRSERVKLVTEKCKSYGVEAIGCEGDLIEESYHTKLIEATIEAFGKLDVLVNCAAKPGGGGLQNGSLEKFDDIMNVNIRSVYNLTRVAASHLIKSQGAIVNVSSITGTHPVPQTVVYGMSKAALDQFTRTVALELGSSKVRVNSVRPGFIKTETYEVLGIPPARIQHLFDTAPTLCPLERIGQPMDIAKAIAFLASDDASFITGQCLYVDGGWSIKGTQLPPPPK